VSAPTVAQLTALGEALGCKPTPRPRPPLPDELYCSEPPQDDPSAIWVDETERWLPDPAKLDRESRRERYRYIDAVSRFKERFSKHAKQRIRARRAARQQARAVGA
jgi:hypothetical protein